MISRMTMYFIQILTGICILALGSFIGFIGLAILFQSVTKNPDEHLLLGSISLAMSVIGPVFIVMGYNMFCSGFFSSSNLSCIRSSSESSASSKTQYNAQ